MKRVLIATLVTLAMPAGHALAQAPASQEKASCLPQGFFPAPPDYKSVEVRDDGYVTFRLCAPEAGSVKVESTDIDAAIPMGMQPGVARGLTMTRDETGLWSATTRAPVPADTYRYWFEVEGARVPDPQATTFSFERTGVASTFEVKGPEGAFQTYKADIPHGTVSQVSYWSDTLGQKREAYVYTPPGYMNDGEDYPVLYLVHGAGDSADSWTSVGHANFIIDNLIAEGKARPMIVVMPFGHTPQKPDTNLLLNPDFGGDLLDSLIPYIDGHFRTVADREHRAMAGLSMGGAHTLNFGLTHPELFDFIGVFSMGLGVSGPGELAAYEKANGPALSRAADSLDLVYYAIGKEDFLYATAAPTRALMEKYGITVDYHESGGGHTWTNWRKYLEDFAPRIFK